MSADAGVPLPWPVALVPVELIGANSGPDLFEVLVRDLALAGVHHPEHVAELTGLERPFVEAIIDELRGRGATHHHPSEPQRVGGWFAIDLASGRPLPVFWTTRPRGVGLASEGELPKLPDDGELRRALDGWRTWWRQERADRRPAAFRETPEVVIGLSRLGNAQKVQLDARLVVTATGAPRVDLEGVPSELLTPILEQTNPVAWQAHQARAAEEKQRIEAERQSGVLLAQAQRLRLDLYGEVPDWAEAVLGDLTLHRAHTQTRPSMHEAARVAYRKFAETVALTLGPAQRSKAAQSRFEELRQTQPKPGDQAKALRPGLEALAHPEPLALPDQVANALDALRKLRQPDHGMALLAWPFLHAALDPQAPETKVVRSACAACPDLWRTLDWLRKEGNPGAHAQQTALDAPDYLALDEAVNACLSAMTGAGRRARSEAPAASADPLDAALACAEQASQPDRGGGWRALAKAACAWAHTLRVGAGADLEALGRELPKEPGRREGALLRRLDGLRPADDDGRGYEPPDWVRASLVSSLDRLTRGQREDPEDALLRPLLCVAAGDPVARGALAPLVAEVDPWAELTPLMRLRDASHPSSTHISVPEWRALFRRAHETLSTLLNHPEPQETLQ